MSKRTDETDSPSPQPRADRSSPVTKEAGLGAAKKAAVILSESRRKTLTRTDSDALCDGSTRL